MYLKVEGRISSTQSICSGQELQLGNVDQSDLIIIAHGSFIGISISIGIHPQSSGTCSLKPHLGQCPCLHIGIGEVRSPKDKDRIFRRSDGVVHGGRQVVHGRNVDRHGPNGCRVGSAIVHFEGKGRVRHTFFMWIGFELEFTQIGGCDDFIVH